MPRARKPNASIPAHIDQGALPKGVYWERGRWYVLDPHPEGGRARKRTVAGPAARLSDLHTIVEQRRGVDTSSLRGVCALFRESPDFRQLAPTTRKSYDYCRDVLCDFKTKIGTPLGDLDLRRLTPPALQRVVDAIGAEHPRTAAQSLGYMKRVLRWAVNRGHAQGNPAASLEAPKLRPKRRLPEHDAYVALLNFARERGALQAHTKGSVAPYLWVAMEIAYRCHLRGIEVLDLTDADATAEHLVTNRRKGSRSTRWEWTPALRAAWDAAIAYRTAVWDASRRPVPMRPELRPLIVSQTGEALRKSSFDTAWQRFVHLAMAEGVITPEQRFSPHDLKRKGITERPGTRADKQLASGHRAAQMLDVYDLSVPTAKPIE